MAGISVSGYVDDEVAERLYDIARAEARSPANVVGQALGFYTSLPEAARNSLCRLDTMASPDELRWCRAEFVRLLFTVDMELTQRRMAEEMASNLPEGQTEEEMEKTAVEWTNGVG